MLILFIIFGLLKINLYFCDVILNIYKNEQGRNKRNCRKIS